MFAVIDSGTTNTRIYIVGEDKKIVASGGKKIGVRDTSITGSKDSLKNGVTELFFEILKESGIPENSVRFAVASGMITSEIGLLEIPHLRAPAGLRDLSNGIVRTEDQAVLPIGRPVYFIRGVKNDFPEETRAKDLRRVDFMRGEEVQAIGVLEMKNTPPPVNIVALSSHTKIIHIDKNRRIASSMTTISGQFYEAIMNSTNIGKSLIPVEGEAPGGYSYEELLEIAGDCVQNAGLLRTMLMPRFMQVLLKTDAAERDIFLNAAIASDDLLAFQEMRKGGFESEKYILYGHKSRCEMYEYLLKKTFGRHLLIESIQDKDEIENLTVRGVIAVAADILSRE